MRKENWFLSGLFQLWKEKKRAIGTAYMMAVVLTVLSIGEYYLFIPEAAMAHVRAETVEVFHSGQYTAESTPKISYHAGEVFQYEAIEVWTLEEYSVSEGRRLEYAAAKLNALKAEREEFEKVQTDGPEEVLDAGEQDNIPKEVSDAGTQDVTPEEIPGAGEQDVTPEEVLLVEEQAAKEVLSIGKRVYEVTEEEVEVLRRIVEAEATGEDIKGKILVANVVLNRVDCKGFPNTISEVVFQQNGNTYQFSPIRDKRYWSVEVTDATIEAVERALAGENYSEGALFFAARKYASKKNMSWFDNNLTFLFQHGGHEFFK